MFHIVVISLSNVILTSKDLTELSIYLLRDIHTSTDKEKYSVEQKNVNVKYISVKKN